MSMDQEIVLGEGVAIDSGAASVLMRAGSGAIDYVVMIAGFWAGMPILGQLLSTSNRAITIASFTAFFVIWAVLVPALVETLTRGLSIGRIAVGLRIVRDDGGAIGFRHAFTRALLGVLDIYMSFRGFAALVALFSPKAKRLGDLVAGTYSQNERITRYSPPTYGVPLQLTEWAKTADVAKMPDRTARRISQFLANAKGFTPQSRAAAAHSLAREASPYVSPIPQADPEIFLAALTAVRRDREFAALQQERSRLQTLAPSLGRTPREFPTRTQEWS